MDASRTRVTISRTNPDDAGHRQIIARIDEGQNVTLLAGESQTLDVAPGPHTLHANNTLFWKKQAFEIAPGEHLEFGVVNIASRMSFGFLAGLGMAPMYLRIERVSAAARDSVSTRLPSR